MLPVGRPHLVRRCNPIITMVLSVSCGLARGLFLAGTGPAPTLVLLVQLYGNTHYRLQN